MSYRRHMRGVLWALVTCAGTTALAQILHPYLHPANIIMLYLVGVMLVASRHGRSASVLVSILSVLSFDFFFVAPRFSIAVSDAQYLLTLAVMLAVSLFISSLTARLRRQARVAQQREARASNLYLLGRELSALLTLEQILDIGRRHLGTVFGARISFFLPDSANRLQQFGATQADHGIAQWVFDQGQAAGRGTATLSAASALYLPMMATLRTRGVLVFAADAGFDDGSDPENRQMLEIFCSQIAIAIERLHYVDVAQQALVSVESERLRNALLGAISHDLRTPLTSLVGSADLLAADGRLPDDARDNARTLSQQSQRLIGLMNNLLDMARLQAGAVTLQRQWNALEEVLGSALRLLQRSLAQHRLKIDLAPDLPLLRVDAVLLDRVLCNLLENASKYAPAGTTITVSAQSHAHEIWVAVSDQGPGFTAAAAPHAFEKFTRGEHESSTPGVGLGLALCRAIIEAHQGRIWIGATTVGASVVFALPLEQQPTAPDEIDPPPHQ